MKVKVDDLLWPWRWHLLRRDENGEISELVAVFEKEANARQVLNFMLDAVLPTAEPRQELVRLLLNAEHACRENADGGSITTSVGELVSLAGLFHRAATALSATPEPSARVLALARIGAEHLHRQGDVLAVIAYNFKAGTIETKPPEVEGHHEDPFETCSHPYCAAVRIAPRAQE